MTAKAFSIFALTLVLVCACDKNNTNSSAKDPIEVDTIKASKSPLTDHINAIGTLKALESVQITAKVTDTISSIHFTDGMRVKKGDILVEMTSEQERAELEEAKASADESKRQLKRLKPLLKTGAVSKSLYDEKRRILKTSEARFNAVKSQLGDRTIFAPFDGVVGLKNISLGMLVRPGDIITTLNDDTKMKLDFSIPSLYLSTIKTGLNLSSSSEAFPNKVFTGTIIAVNNEIDPITRSISVRAIIDNPDFVLKQGLLMSVNVTANERINIRIPEESIVSEGRDDFIYKVENQENSLIAKKTKIKVGATYPGFIEVLEGIKEGETIVTRGGFKLYDNAPVKINNQNEHKEESPKNTPQDNGEETNKVVINL